MYWSQTERTWPFYWTPIHSQGEGQGPAGPSNDPSVPAARWQRPVVVDRSANGFINSLAMDVRGQERPRSQWLLNVSGRWEKRSPFHLNNNNDDSVSPALLFHSIMCELSREVRQNRPTAALIFCTSHSSVVRHKRQVDVRHPLCGGHDFWSSKLLMNGSSQLFAGDKSRKVYTRLNLRVFYVQKRVETLYNSDINLMFYIRKLDDDHQLRWGGVTNYWLLFPPVSVIYYFTRFTQYSKMFLQISDIITGIMLIHQHNPII